MSFFKKLTKEFDELGLGTKQKKDYDEDLAYSGKRDAYPPAQPYGDSGPSPGYGGTPVQYQSPPPAPAQNQVTPVYSPPADKPPIPSGWVPEWDQHYQRWYYYDTRTGHSQWEAPGYVEPHDDRGAQPSTVYGQYAGGGSQHDGQYSGHGTGQYSGGGGEYEGHYSGRGGGQYGYEEEKKSRGYGGMMLGAAGGLVAGAVIADALDDSDDEGYHAAPPPPPPVPQSYYPPPPADLSESDRESLEEARKDYEEALDDARSSSASSSDLEELEEAREEYYEELEEAYDD